jgi:O-antigen ligase
MLGPERAPGSVAPARDPHPLLGVCLLLAVTTPLCLFVGVKGFAPVVGVCGLLCLPWARPARADWPGLVILAALVIWAAVSVAWSPAPNLHAPHSAKALSRFTILHLAGQLVFCTALVTALARLDGRAAGRALGWIALGVLLATPLLIEEAWTHARIRLALMALAHQSDPPDRTIAFIAQAGYVAAVMAWPLGVALHRQGRPRLALVPAILAPLLMVLLRGVAPTAALLISLPVFVLTLRYGPRAIAGLAAITAAYMLGAPYALRAAEHMALFPRLESELPLSWADRLRIWGGFAGRLAGRPLLGAGLDASRVSGVALHPHNAPLQLWYELGLPGAVLGALFWIWLWGRIGYGARRDRLQAAAAAATAAVYLTISAVSFGLWQDWWLSVGALATTLCVLLGGALASRRRLCKGVEARTADTPSRGHLRPKATSGPKARSGLV